VAHWIPQIVDAVLRGTLVPARRALANAGAPPFFYDHISVSFQASARMRFSRALDFRPQII